MFECVSGAHRADFEQASPHRLQIARVLLRPARLRLGQLEAQIEVHALVRGGPKPIVAQNFVGLKQHEDAIVDHVVVEGQRGGVVLPARLGRIAPRPASGGVLRGRIIARARSSTALCSAFRVTRHNRRKNRVASVVV